MKSNKMSLRRVKVILIGVENSGKTSLVNQLSPSAKSIEHHDKGGSTLTVGLDIGKAEHAGYALSFFGTPGHERFEFVRKIVSHGAHLGILMIDSVEVTQQGISQRDKDYESELKDKNIPYIICANKCDVKGVMKPSQIAPHFQADVYPVSAKTGEGVDAMRNALIDIIEQNKDEWFASKERRLKSA